ncbi:MAG: hypothetical protein KBF66_06365 [Rhodoferax sp.]|uniref:hypothetical protein n=1 Tax=Rhodoferax sp. TaxID=50421 RepID=UPI001B7907CA|nr:hypothetical protein [Rhodoferax sp.]MBP9905163.1 hypothetical protein [Rhodoferax sp.]
MTHPFPKMIKLTCLAIALAGTSLAQAADPVTDAMQAANGPYRMALYKTNGTSQAEAQQALTQAQQAWEKLNAQVGGKPSAPYDRDAAFGKSVSAVSQVYAKAMTEIAANDLKGAHNTLEDAREIMADMRQRNNVVVFSDHMNAYHAVMEHIIVDGNNTLAQPKGMLLLTGQAGALSYLAKRLTTQAPASHSQNPEFTSLVDAVNKSVAALDAALLNQDLAAVKDAVSKLKGPYSKLFAKFG